MTVKAEKSAEFRFGIIGNLLRNGRMAVVAIQSVYRIIFFQSGFRMHDLVGVPVGFRVVASSNRRLAK